MKGKGAVYMETLSYMDVMVKMARKHVGKLKAKV
jgi:hypothetical protein